MGASVRWLGIWSVWCAGSACLLASCGGEGKSSHAGAGASAGSAEGGEAGSSPSAGGASSAGTGTGVAGESSGGEGGEPEEPDSGEGGEGGAPEGGGPIVYTSGKLDLLFVVDNSISMVDKQALLAQSLPALVERLVEPWCVEDGEASPPLEDGSCPDGAGREHAAVKDLHIGVISSSLGGHGTADTCADATEDDRGELLGKLREGLTSWNESGFLKWDPEGEATPPGTSDAGELAQDLEAMVLAAGDGGCGYEAPLESLYRFLVDPDPPLTIELTNGATAPNGTNQALLDQRAAFLRPDSVVMAVVITDENDCSIVDRGSGYIVTMGGSFNMPRATAACAEDPNDVCCRSCASSENSPPEGCAPIASDTECLKGTASAPADDHLNVRCFDQKRRFGFDLLYPLERYVKGFSELEVPNRQGDLVENPLFAGGRDPSLMTLTVIAGVPWQDLALDYTDAEKLDFLSTEELSAKDRWDVVLGSPESFEPPSDPFMRESIDARSGTNPVTGQLVVANDSTNPQATINGHETNIVDRDDLQYACIFPLQTPFVCEESNYACDCQPSAVTYNRALCQPPGGGAASSTQSYAKAYPGLRLLGVAKQLESQSVVASICPRNVSNEASDDFGYYPALRALRKRLAPKLE